jgi:hypothetical protein
MQLASIIWDVSRISQPAATVLLMRMNGAQSGWYEIRTLWGYFCFPKQLFLQLSMTTWANDVAKCQQYKLLPFTPYINRVE